MISVNTEVLNYSLEDNHSVFEQVSHKLILKTKEGEQ